MSRYRKVILNNNQQKVLEEIRFNFNEEQSDLLSFSHNLAIFLKKYQEKNKLLKRQMLELVKISGNLILELKNPSKEVVEKAFEDYVYSIFLIENPTYDQFLSAVKRRGSILRHISEKIKKLPDYKRKYIEEEAVKNNPIAIEFVEKQTDWLCHLAIKKNPEVIHQIKNQKTKFCLEVIRKNPDLINYIRKLDKESAFTALEIMSKIAMKDETYKTKTISSYSKHWIKKMKKIKYNFYFEDLEERFTKEKVKIFVKFGLNISKKTKISEY